MISNQNWFNLKKKKINVILKLKMKKEQIINTPIKYSTTHRPTISEFLMNIIRLKKTRSHKKVVVCYRNDF